MMICAQVVNIRVYIDWLFQVQVMHFQVIIGSGLDQPDPELI